VPGSVRLAARGDVWFVSSVAGQARAASDDWGLTAMELLELIVLMVVAFAGMYVLSVLTRLVRAVEAIERRLDASLAPSERGERAHEG
jgi:hypothetical protein